MDGEIGGSMLQIFLSFSPLFYYKLFFMTELLVAEAFVCFRLRKRRRFALRLAVSLLCIYAVALFFPIFVYNAWYSTVIFLSLYLCSVAAAKVCFDEQWKNIFFCTITAYTMQHLSYEVYNYIVSATGLSQEFSLGIYGESSSFNDTIFGSLFSLASVPSINFYFILPIYFAVYFCMYWLIYKLIEDRLSAGPDLQVGNAFYIALAGLGLLINILLSLVISYIESGEYNFIYQTVATVYNVLCCIFILFFQFGFVQMKKLDRDLGVVQTLWAEDRQHYELSKESINIINVKCHDLRHHIRNLRLGGTVSEGALLEVEQAIGIYDSVVKTGNETLDVVLSEKSLFCESHGIQFSCMADGKALSFMEGGDIYSLFGNALDNAIEYVRTLDAPEKRIIRLAVRAQGQVLSIHIENYFEGVPPVLRDGLPVTTKSDKNFHGFGIMSMKMLAKKYGGELFFSVGENLFRLDVLLPKGEDKMYPTE